jgi:hypothetical protein
MSNGYWLSACTGCLQHWLCACTGCLHVLAVCSTGCLHVLAVCMYWLSAALAVCMYWLCAALAVCMCMHTGCVHVHVLAVCSWLRTSAPVAATARPTGAGVRRQRACGAYGASDSSKTHNRARGAERALPAMWTSPTSDLVPRACVDIAYI